MKILVTGVKGQLGYDVVREAERRGHEAFGVDVEEMDLTCAESVARVTEKAKPQAVVHCAAWTAVDAAEEEGNLTKARAVNEGGTRNLAAACKKLGCKMIYISTDYVYGDYDSAPWSADADYFEPANLYGLTKLEGEFAVKELIEKYFIVRTSWVFGKNGNNFVKTMLRLAKTHPSLRVVNDQIGTPTYTPDLARLLVDMLETEKYGTYNASNEGGYVSWAEFAEEIFKQAGCATEVVPVTTEEYGMNKAYRPRNSRLDKSKLVKSGFRPLPVWQDALKRYLKELADGTD